MMLETKQNKKLLPPLCLLGGYAFSHNSQEMGQGAPLAPAPLLVPDWATQVTCISKPFPYDVGTGL